MTRSCLLLVLQADNTAPQTGSAEMGTATASSQEAKKHRAFVGQGLNVAMLLQD